MLENSDLVLGPTFDGGYWLIGLRRLERDLFREIPWSTDRVLAATSSRASEIGLSITLLRKLEDIDTVEEWRRFQKSFTSAVTEHNGTAHNRP